MSTFLAISSVIGFMVCIVLLIISAIKKNGKVKKWGIGIGISFVCFIVALIMIPSNPTSKPVATAAVTSPAPVKTPEEIEKEKADKVVADTKATLDAEAKVKQDADAKVAAEAKEKSDAEAKVVADKAEAEAKIAREAKAIENQKAASVTIPYKDLARNPDTHMYAKVKYTGEVIQVQEDGDNVALRVNVTKGTYGYEDTIMVTYNKGIIEGRVLDKDIVTLYGKYYGLTTYKTVLGAEMTIPKIKATIIELVK